MVYDYLITLKRPDFKAVDIISQLLYLIAFATFIYLATKAPVFVNIYSIAALIILVIFILVKLKTKRQGKAYFTPGLAIATLTWLFGFYPSWIMFALYAACTLIERELKFNKEIGFTPEEVVLNTLVKKHYDWNEFRNLLIKDGILTLDFKTNKIIQKEIDGEVSDTMQQEFNDFCREQLNAVYSREAQTNITGS